MTLHVTTNNNIISIIRDGLKTANEKEVQVCITNCEPQEIINLIEQVKETVLVYGNIALARWVRDVQGTMPPIYEIGTEEWTLTDTIIVISIEPRYAYHPIDKLIDMERTISFVSVTPLFYQDDDMSNIKPAH